MTSAGPTERAPRAREELEDEATLALSERSPETGPFEAAATLTTSPLDAGEVPTGIAPMLMPGEVELARAEEATVAARPEPVVATPFAALLLEAGGGSPRSVSAAPPPQEPPPPSIAARSPRETTPAGPRVPPPRPLPARLELAIPETPAPAARDRPATERPESMVLSGLVRAVEESEALATAVPTRRELSVAAPLPPPRPHPDRVEPHEVAALFARDSELLRGISLSDVQLPPARGLDAAPLQTPSGRSFGSSARDDLAAPPPRRSERGPWPTDPLLELGLRSPEEVAAEAASLRRGPLRELGAGLSSLIGRGVEGTLGALLRFESLPRRRQLLWAIAPYVAALGLVLVLFGLTRGPGEQAPLQIAPPPPSEPELDARADTVVRHRIAPARPGESAPRVVTIASKGGMEAKSAAELEAEEPADAPTPASAAQAMVGEPAVLPIRSALFIRPDVEVARAARLPAGARLTVYPRFPAPAGWVLAQSAKGTIGFLSRRHLAGQPDPAVEAQLP